MRINKKIAALAVASALILAGLSAAQAAQADQIPGTITITPTSGNASDTFFITSVATSVGAPVGYRNASTSQIFQGGVLKGNISNLRLTSMASTYGTNGLDGNPAYLDRSVTSTNNYVSNKSLGAIVSPLVTGNFEYRYYYHALSTSLDLVNDKYLSLTLYYDAATGNWGPPVVLTPTTTSLTASAAGTTVTLNATVKNGAATVATTGNIVFSEGATVVATVPATAGVATATLSGVANGSHTYTAAFAGDATFAASASGNASVGVGLLGPVDATSGPGSLSPNVIVTIPNNVGTLTLSGVTSVVDLGTAVLGGGTLNASGTLAAVVTDTRQLDKAPWNLTGQVGDFTSGAKVLSGKYLGWTPAIAAGTTALGSTAGAVVFPAPATTLGLKAVGSILVNGYPDVTGTVTNASALLQLKAPSNTPAGNYSALLTLTLV
jgi:hypothetical protein